MTTLGNAGSTKGVRKYQEIVNYFLALDRSRGMSFDELADKYNLDRSALRKRIIRYMNEN